MRFNSQKLRKKAQSVVKIVKKIRKRTFSLIKIWWFHKNALSLCPILEIWHKA